jgi:MHS family citrate/tricarballylate:H+ symporter-like MFS transporter
MSIIDTIPAVDQNEKTVLPKRFVAAVLLGNMLEFYDYLIFAYFAVYIAKAFFPDSSPDDALIRTLAIFAGGFLARPLGAFVIGRIADRRGRKPAMIVSFVMMGVAGLGMAATPSTATIGVTAVLLVAFFRLLQSFALGGEVGAISAYLVESAPAGRRGSYMALQTVTQALGSALAGFAGYILSTVLDRENFERYGWRIALLVGFLIVPIGVIARRKLPESAPIREAASDSNGVKEEVRWRPFLGPIAIGFVGLSCATFIGYSQNYTTTYVLHTLHGQPRVAFILPLVNNTCQVIFAILSGRLSDKFGRKPIMIISSIALAFAVLPVFFSIIRFQAPAVLYVGIGLLTTLGAFASGPVGLYLTEALPSRIRAGAVGIVYACSTAIFGGSTQLVLTWMISRTGNPMVPAYCWAVAALAGGLAFTFARETAPAKRRGE